MERERSLSLYELNVLIREIIESNFFELYWIRAEIARISVSASGHCFLELVDREIPNRMARGSAVMWSGIYRSISKRFKEETGTELSSGIKILMLAEVKFHEEYGLKLIIRDIDPAYTIGEMAVKKRMILERLYREGLLQRNKMLPLPLVPQNIAIISSKSAAGFQDFIHHIELSPYRFKWQLFESTMQGSSVEESILEALRNCKSRASDFDILVIVRGGGSKADLHCFDNYELAKAIAMMPIPVVSGIGHERDTSVVDEVSAIRVKTPTAAAELIINMVKEFEESIDELIKRIVEIALLRIDYEKELLGDFLNKLAFKTDALLHGESNILIATQ
ncbi:MAG: exodeoxyribonuclease VII large subunit, partial [Nitrospirae bacterium]